MPGHGILVLYQTSTLHFLCASIALLQRCSSSALESLGVVFVSKKYSSFLHASALCFKLVWSSLIPDENAPWHQRGIICSTSLHLFTRCQILRDSGAVGQCFWTCQSHTRSRCAMASVRHPLFVLTSRTISQPLQILPSLGDDPQHHFASSTDNRGSLSIKVAIAQRPLLKNKLFFCQVTAPSMYHHDNGHP